MEKHLHNACLCSCCMRKTARKILFNFRGVLPLLFRIGRSNLLVLFVGDLENVWLSCAIIVGKRCRFGAIKWPVVWHTISALRVFSAQLMLDGVFQLKYDFNDFSFDSGPNYKLTTTENFHFSINYDFLPGRLHSAPSTRRWVLIVFVV